MNPPLPRWLLAMLVGSVTLNLVGLGWIAGRATAEPHIPVAPAAPEPIHGFVFSESDGGERRMNVRGPGTDVQREIVVHGVPAVPMPEFPGAVPGGLQWIVANLPPERRETIAMEIEVLQRPLLEEARAMTALRENVREALARRPFDREVLQDALRELRERIAGTQAETHAILAEVASELTAAERVALAGRLVSPAEAAVPRVYVHRREWREEKTGDEDPANP